MYEPRKFVPNPSLCSRDKRSGINALRRSENVLGDRPSIEQQDCQPARSPQYRRHHAPPLRHRRRALGDDQRVAHLRRSLERRGQFGPARVELTQIPHAGYGGLVSKGVDSAVPHPGDEGHSGATGADKILQ